MTLVLPFGGDQINNSLFSGTGSSRNSSMPCVFDGEALDFESALMTDWTSDISDYNTPADDFTTAAPSDSSDLKRKSSISDNEAQPSQPKKLRTDHGEDSVNRMQSDIVSSSTSSSLSIDFHEPNVSSSASSSPYLAHSSLDSTSSLPISSEEQDTSSPAEEEDYLPRRRGPQMWNSRQRWKDERKKVLKMSVNKLTEIEDPELCLLRSVLINNTIKKLHYDIKNERQAKVRQRQQRMDYYAEKFQPLDVIGDDTPTSTDPFVSDLENHPQLDDEPTKSCTSSSDLYDETSCDEIFGISDDFLRVAIPDRRVSSPIPTSQRDSSDMDTSDCENQQSAVAKSNTQTTCYTSSSSSPHLSASCDNAIDCASSRFYPENTTSSSTISSDNSSSGGSSYSVSSSLRRLVGPVSGGSQCATQFRTNRDLGVSSGGDNIFPPRVPILDSVVYHSLLASLESS